MSVIVDITVPATDFALGQLFQADPEMRVRLERVIPLGETVIPYLWIADGSLATVEDSLRADPQIEAFDVVDTVDTEALIRIDWQAPLDGLMESLLEADGVILAGVGTAESWEFQLRFPAHDDLAAFHRRCADRDVAVRLDRIHNPGLPEEVGLGFELTDTQRETLLIALEAGYFDVPRKTNIVELAEDLGVSDTAVSQRLRRGLKTLLTATLASADRPTDPPVDE